MKTVHDVLKILEEKGWKTYNNPFCAMTATSTNGIVCINFDEQVGNDDIHFRVEDFDFVANALGYYKQTTMVE